MMMKISRPVFLSQLFWRLYTGYVAIVLISTLIVGMLVSRMVTDSATRDIEQSLSVRAELLAELVQISWKLPQTMTQVQSLQATVTRLGLETQSRFTVINDDGAVIADSQQIPTKMDNHNLRPEIIEARANGSSMIVRFSQTLNRQMVYRALQLKQNNQIVIGFVRVSLPLSLVENKLTELRLFVLYGAAIATFIALLLGFYFARKFSEPLSRMTEYAETITQGNYHERISVKRQDELGKLAEALNRMAINASQRMAEITTDRNRLATIFTGMVEGVIGVDQNQKIIHVNQAAVDLLKLSMTDCINRPIQEEVPVKEIILALQQVQQKKGVVNTQMRCSSQEDERIVDIYVAALSQDDKESPGAVIVLHDISELDHLERIRRDFVANASHELKTPITAIRGLTETILDDEAMEAEIRQQFIQKIHAQSLRLSSLVTDLMTISRLESDPARQHFQAFDLKEVVKRSVSGCQSSCTEKKQKMSISLTSDSVFIEGDMQAIRQLIDNLVDNAIKYTPVAGSIKIILNVEESFARLIVEDTGIGISPVFQQRVFERFYRVDKARSRELGGTGLGLSIVKNIAEQHGGSVAVKSQPGAGSTFIVTIPMMSPSALADFC